MMMKTWLTAIGAALAITAAAEAQDTLGRQPTKPVPPQETPTPPVNPPLAPPEAMTAPGSDVSASVSQFVPGMTVEDRQGVRIGEITSAGQAADGGWTISVSIDGKPYDVASTSLALSATGDSAVSAYTKAEIKAAARR